MQYLDELKVLKLYADDGRKYELKADFKALKKLNNLMSGFKIDDLYISNAFDCIDKFLNQVKFRIVLLPYFIKAMVINEDLSIEYIENHILGMNFKRIGQAINVIFELLSIEFKTDNNDEIKKKNQLSE